MRQRVRNQQRSCARQRRHCAEVGGVARREDQCRLSADEIRERGLEAFVQFGVSGHQPRPRRARAPGAQRLDAAVDHLGVLREAEVVVGRQIELGTDGRAGAKRSAQAGRAPLLLDLVEPGQRGKTDASHLTIARAVRSSPNRLITVPSALHPTGSSPCRPLLANRLIAPLERCSG